MKKVTLMTFFSLYILVPLSSQNIPPFLFRPCSSKIHILCLEGLTLIYQYNLYSPNWTLEIQARIRPKPNMGHKFMAWARPTWDISRLTWPIFRLAGLYITYSDFLSIIWRNQSLNYKHFLFRWDSGFLSLN